MRPLFALSLAACTALLCGCSPWPIGEDPQGRSLLENADRVLVAANTYRKENGRAPGTLKELAPTYLAALPPEPQLRYDAGRGALEFIYTPSLSSGLVYCRAALGDPAFHCDQP
jgi:hypothetical protein